MKEIIDLEADGKAASEDQLAAIVQLAERQLELQEEVNQIELQLKKKAEELKNISQNILPDAMENAGISELKLSNGAKLSLKKDMSIAVPKSRMEDICEWLREQKHDSLILHQLVTEIPKGKDDLAAKAIKLLAPLKLMIQDTENVNSTSLKALLKDLRAKGSDVDLGFFGAYEYKKAEIKIK